MMKESLCWFLATGLFRYGADCFYDGGSKWFATLAYIVLPLAAGSDCEAA